MKNNKNIFASDLVQSALSFGTKLGSGFAAYILFAIISRLIGAESFGQFSIAFSLALMVGLAGSMGQQVFIVREVPKQRALSNPAGERAVYAFTVLILLLAAPVTFIVNWGLAYYLVPDTTPMLLLSGSVLAVVYGVSQATIGMLRVQGATIFAIFTRDLLWRVLAIPTVYILVSLLTNASLGLVALAGWLIPVTIWHISKIIPHLRETLDVKAGPIGKGWWQSSIGLGLIGVISSADFYIYTILLGWFLTAYDAGLFFASLKTAELLNMFLMAVTLVIAPRLSHMIATEDTDGLQLNCNFGLVLQTIPLALALLLLLPGSRLILTLFDPSYGDSWPLLWLLSAIMLFNALTGATVLLMQVGGMHWQQVGLQGGCLLLSIIVLPFFVQVYDVYGAALSFGVSKLLWNVAAVYLIRRKLGVDPSLIGLFRKQGGGFSGVFQLMKEQMSAKRGT